LLLGARGVGTSRLARRLAMILPAICLAEARETTRLHRVAGPDGGRTAVVTTRPFQAPHTIADVGLICGGQRPTPGEVSLAHHGLLFLDELPECTRHGLEVWRQPLDNGIVMIARILLAVTFPTDLTLRVA
jgi:magnesium chelatase family protein